LPIPPPNLVDLWRIEGEGPDLHLHQSVLHFPLIHLRDLSLGFPLGKPRHLVVLTCLLLLCSEAVVLGSSQSFCGLCSKLVVRALDSALKDSDKERWTELLCEVHRRIG